MKKNLFLSLFLLILASVFLFKPSFVLAQTCTPASTYQLINISGVFSYYNYGTSVCTAVAGGNYNNVYANATPTTYTGQAAIVNCGSTGSGIVYYGSAGCSGGAKAYSGGACVSQTVTCTSPTTTTTIATTTTTRPATTTTTTSAGACSSGTDNYCGLNNGSPNGAYAYYTGYAVKNSCVSGVLRAGTACTSGTCALTAANTTTCVSDCAGHGGTCSSSCPGGILPSGTNGYYCPIGTGSCCSSSTTTTTTTPTGGATHTCYTTCGSNAQSGPINVACSTYGWACAPWSCVCTPTTSCAAQNLTCGNLYNGCATVSCGPTCGSTLPSISGVVYVDTIGNGYNGASVSDSWLLNGNTYTNTATTYNNGITNGWYSMAAPQGATYKSISLIVPSGYTAITTNPVDLTGTTQNTTVNFGIHLAPTTSSLTINVYNDNNGNGFQDTGETGHAGATVAITGQGAGTYTTNASGQVVVSNVNPGSSTATVTLPAGYTATTTNPKSTTLPPSQTLNFGIRAPAPTCTLSYNPAGAIHAIGDQKTLTLNCSGFTGTPTYTFQVDSGTLPSGRTSDTTTSNSDIWTANTATMSQTNVQVGASGCDSATGLCGIATVQIPVTPFYTISGNVFVDLNSDGIDSGESNYTGTPAININSSGGDVSIPSAGNYLVQNLPAGQYTVTYTNPPTANGYIVTYPKGVGNPSFRVTVGPSCNANDARTPANLVAACDPSGNGNIVRLNFGITNAIPWMQSTGGDITGVNFSTNGGFTDTIPSSATLACGGHYASVVPGGGVTTPGIVYSGATTPNFGQGTASINNWSVGTSSYPEVYTPPIPNTIKTSYNYITALAQSSGAVPTPICGSGGDCTLPFTAGSHGVYIINGNVRLMGTGSPNPSYTFPPNGQYVILVNGDLVINTQIHVPNGGSVLITASGSITVDKTVGESSPTSSTWDLEGYYSADKNFIVDGFKACPIVDKRLNVAGAIVANASLQSFSFSYNRDLCAADLQCPVFSITERPDFILNSTEFLKPTRRVWQEIAP